jgi:hypothetical protein
MVKNSTVFMFLLIVVALWSNEMSTKYLLQHFNELRKFIKKIPGEPQTKIQSGRIY